MRTEAAVVGMVVTFAAGIGVGIGIKRTKLELELRAEYEESAASYKRTIDMMNKIGDTVASVQDDFSQVEYPEVVHDNQGTEIVAPEDGTIMMSEVQNSYHTAISKVITETPIEMFVEGAVNDYGVSYLEEEDYLEDDGRFKGKIDILMDDHNPVFLMDGEQIDDWDERIGASILVDFYNLVPPGIEPILYVRNHNRDEDYEVVRVVQ